VGWTRGTLGIVAAWDFGNRCGCRRGNRSIFAVGVLKMSSEAKVLPHQQRVIDEYRELDERTEKLGDFFDNDLYAKLDRAEQDRLESQWFVMKAYRVILIQRLEAMGFEDYSVWKLDRVLNRH
jgi:hypothetical protein